MRLQQDKPKENPLSDHKGDVLPGIVATVTDGKQNAVYVDLDLELEPVQPGADSRQFAPEDIPPGLAAAVLKRQKRRLPPLLQRLPLSPRQALLMCGVLAVFILFLGVTIYWLYPAPPDAFEPPAETAAQPSEAMPAPAVQEQAAAVRQPDTPVPAETAASEKPAAAAPEEPGLQNDTAASAPAAPDATDNMQPAPAVEAQAPEEPVPPASSAKTEKQKIVRETASRPQETPDYYVYSGYTCEARGDYPGALGWYKQALVFDRQGYRLLNKIAFVLMRMALYDDAATYALQSLSAKNDYMPALVNMGIIRAQQGKYDEAEGYFSDALTRDGTNTAALYNSMLLCKKQGNYQRAMEIEQKLKALGYPGEP